MDVLKRWLPVVVWSAVILFASSDRFAPEETGAFLRELFGIELPHWLHVTLRKLGHVLGYGILGALAIRAARVDFRRPVPVAVAIVVFIATIDEWHQATTALRTGQVSDVLLDVVAGAVVIALLVQKWRPR